MSVARYIELCKSLRDAEEGPEVDKLIADLDRLYLGLSEHERQAVDAHFAAQEPG